MYQKPTVPRSIGGVLDDTFQLYKASFSSCWLPTLLMSVAGISLGVYKLHEMPAVAAGGGLQQLITQYTATTPAYQVTSVVVSLIQLLVYGMLVLIITKVSRGEVPTFGESMTAALRRLPAMIGAGFLYGLAVGVGFILLIIPGIYVLNRLQLFMVPLVADPQGPGNSLATSWRLIGGNWWRTASLMFVMVVMVYVLTLALVAVAGAVAVVISGAPTSIVQGISKFAVMGVVINGLVAVFTTPLLSSVSVALYQDLLLRKGGGDLEARLGALPKA